MMVWKSTVVIDEDDLRVIQNILEKSKNRGIDEEIRIFAIGNKIAIRSKAVT